MPIDEKGQITVEAVLILGFFILIFIGVTVPMAFDARNAGIDTTILTDAKFVTQQIATAASTVIINGSRRTIDVYVPGYSAGSINISTKICNDSTGSYLNTTVNILRTGINETHKLSSKLYGSGWNINSGSCITENIGRRYTVLIEYKNITMS
jgi:uncharacterized protein (UPF0333 family)